MVLFSTANAGRDSGSGDRVGADLAEIPGNSLSDSPLTPGFLATLDAVSGCFASSGGIFTGFSWCLMGILDTRSVSKLFPGKPLGADPVRRRRAAAAMSGVAAGGLSSRAGGLQFDTRTRGRAL